MTNREKINEILRENDTTLGELAFTSGYRNRKGNFVELNKNLADVAVEMFLEED